MGRRPRWLDLSRSALLPMALFSCLLVGEVVAVVWLNGGHFTYTLDDAYIHLALAESIARGEYGVNPGEFSAPSSSLAWPLLLAPLAGLGRYFAFVPLLFATLAAAMTVFGISRMAGTAVDAGVSDDRRLFGILLACLLIPATNVVGLVLTGMEHSVQVLFALGTVAGLIHESRTGRVPWWLTASLIAGPAFRYENLALVVPALVVLLARRQRATVVWASLALAVSLLGFALFLGSHDLGPVPTSAALKSDVARDGPDPRTVLINLSFNLRNTQAIGLAAIAGILAGGAIRRVRDVADRNLALALATAAGVHLLAGRFGWYHRYEIYVWVACVTGAIHVWRHPIRSFVDRRGWPLVAGVTVVALASVGGSYASVLLTAPLAANNIYQQPMQLHRFATEYLQSPVAVTDLGCVAYRNDRHVLDLRGLASAEVARLHRERADHDWMTGLARRFDVGVVMIHDSVLGDTPPDWREIGRLHLGRRRVTLASDHVTFYALDRRAERRVRELLPAFAESLPEGVRFLSTPPEPAARRRRVDLPAGHSPRLVAGGPAGVSRRRSRVALFDDSPRPTDPQSRIRGERGR